MEHLRSISSFEDFYSIGRKAALVFRSTAANDNILVFYIWLLEHRRFLAYHTRIQIIDLTQRYILSNDLPDYVREFLGNFVMEMMK